MNRRDTLLALLVLGGASVPFASIAQPTKRPWRVGTVFGASWLVAKPYEEAFLTAMKDLGYVIGHNLTFDSRVADGNPTRYPALVDEVMALEPDVLIGANTAVAIEMKSRTTTIPIVLATSVDPVRSGLAQSLARPGGNVTGVSVQLAELIQKQIELLGELLPQMRRVALLLDVSSAPTLKLSEDYERDAKAIAAGKGLSIQPHRIDIQEGIGRAFRVLETQRPDALIVAPAPMFNAFRREIAQNAIDLRLPGAAFVDDYAQDGILISYGPSFVEAFRRVAYFVDRILKGSKPGNLPIEQPTKFRLVINAKTAKALGIKFPRSILLRADQVIE
jgi:putative ABC transport system substrate-binding protein